jgi:PadR family transcriptional regulator, regulatory protein PadR
MQGRKEIKYIFAEFSGKMDQLTGFQRDLLYVIKSANQPSGQDIKEEIEKYYSGEINHGRLYPNLDTLVNKELIEKGELDRRTNYYAITDTGEQAIQDRREWEEQYVEP